jgi:hypothetical protein
MSKKCVNNKCCKNVEKKCGEKMRLKNVLKNTITMTGNIGFDSGKTKFNFNPGVNYELPIFFNDIQYTDLQSTSSNFEITTENFNFSDKKILSKITSIKALTDITFYIDIELNFISIDINRDINGFPKLPYKINSSTYLKVDDKDVGPDISIATEFNYNTGDYFVGMGRSIKGLLIQVTLTAGQILRIFGYLSSVNVNTGVLGDCLVFNAYPNSYVIKITY